MTKLLSYKCDGCGICTEAVDASIKGARKSGWVHYFSGMGDFCQDCGHVPAFTLQKNISEIEISNAVMKKLHEIGVTHVYHLVQMTEAQLFRVPRFGRKSMNNVKMALSLIGLRLGMEQAPIETAMACLSQRQRRAFSLST